MGDPFVIVKLFINADYYVIPSPFVNANDRHGFLLYALFSKSFSN